MWQYKYVMSSKAAIHFALFCCKSFHLNSEYFLETLSLTVECIDKTFHA